MVSIPEAKFSSWSYHKKTVMELAKKINKIN